MNEQYTRSLTWSTVIHALVFALVLLAGFVAKWFATPEPIIFELVAGEGDNYRATEAPAAQPSALNLPNRPPQQTPVRQPDPPPVQQKITPPPKQAPRVEPRVETKAPAPAPKVEQKATVMNYSDYLKQNPIQEQKQAPAPRPAPIPKIDPNVARGGTAPSNAKGASGTAASSTAGDDLARWYRLLSDRLREYIVKPEGVSNTLVAGVQLTVEADGSFTGRVVRSSGNPAFDRAVNDAIRRVSLVGMPPKPDRRAETVTIDFRMVDPTGN